MSGMTAAATEPLANATPTSQPLDNWVATPVVSADHLDAALAQLADSFGAFWVNRLARPPLDPEVSLISGQLVVRFPEGLLDRERALGSTPEGAAAVRRELQRKLDTLYPLLADQVEQKLHCFVAESQLTVDFDAGALGCVVTLRDLPRTLGS